MGQFEPSTCEYIAKVIWILVESTRVAALVEESGINEVLDPARYLAMLGWVLVAATAAFIYSIVRTTHDSMEEESVEALTTRPLYPLAAMLLYAFFLPWAGFTIANFVFLVLILVLSSGFGVARAIALALALTAALHVIFIALLAVPFPALGLLGI